MLAGSSEGFFRAGHQQRRQAGLGPAADNAFSNWKDYNLMIRVGGWRTRRDLPGKGSDGLPNVVNFGEGLRSRTTAGKPIQH
jgi:hypothetical protein